MALMSANVSLKNIEGLDLQLADVLKAVDANLEATADHVEAEAKATTAFKDLTKTLRSRIKKKKSKFADGGWIVVARAPHAHLVEYGHVMIAWGRVTGKRVPPHPFMRPALEKGIRFAAAKFKEAQG